MKNRITSLLMVFMILFGTVSVSATSTDEGYVIYPNPQTITYAGGTVTISDAVNVVYGGAIDSYTKAYVTEILSAENKTITEGSSISDAYTNMLVGVYGAGDAADTYFSENSLVSDASIFNNHDAYLMHIADDVIAILGKDTDAAFYGLTTLKHILSQAESSVKALDIVDYADVMGRGYIEGFYGTPWSHESRLSIIDYAGDFKINQYIYAPKNDSKHKSAWRTLYTDDELATIGELAERGNYNKCYFVYALHPFHDEAKMMFDTEENYQADLTIIKNKFEQLMKVGVKQFAILADDATVPEEGSETYVKLMSDLTEWVQLKKAEYAGLKDEILFCPNNYMGNGSGDQMQTLKDLPETVSVIQTGGAVFATVNSSFLNTFYDNMQRPAFLWINWPVNDGLVLDAYSIMGGEDHVFKTGVDASKLSGVVINPSNKSEVSKRAVFSSADYLWNIWDSKENADEAWNDSFSYLENGTFDDTEASVALREFSKHLKHAPGYNNEESEEIKDTLSAFLSDFNSGNSIKASSSEIIGIFEEIQKNVDAYEAAAENTVLLEQLKNTIKSFDIVNAGIINLVEAAVAIEELDGDTAEEKYTLGQDAIASYKANRVYQEESQYFIGKKYITPFMYDLASAVGAKLENIDEIKKFDTNIEGADESTYNNAIDGNDNTYVEFSNGTAKDDYVALMFATSKNIDSVRFNLGENGETFTSAHIEYSYDGSVWKSLETTYENPSEAVATDLNLYNVKGIRLVADEASSNSLIVRDIFINSEGNETIEVPGFTLFEQSFAGLTKLPDEYTLSGVYKEPDNNGTSAWTNGITGTDWHGFGIVKNSMVNTYSKEYSVSYNLKRFYDGSVSWLHFGASSISDAKSNSAVSGYSLKIAKTGDDVTYELYKGTSKLTGAKDELRITGSTYAFSNLIYQFDVTKDGVDLSIINAANGNVLLTDSFADASPVYSGYLGAFVANNNGNGSEYFKSVKVEILPYSYDIKLDSTPTGATAKWLYSPQETLVNYDLRSASAAPSGVTLSTPGSFNANGYGGGGTQATLTAPVYTVDANTMKMVNSGSTSLIYECKMQRGNAGTKLEFLGYTLTLGSSGLWTLKYGDTTIASGSETTEINNGTYCTFTVEFKNGKVSLDIDGQKIFTDATDLGSTKSGRLYLYSQMWYTRISYVKIYTTETYAESNNFYMNKTFSPYKDTYDTLSDEGFAISESTTSITNGALKRVNGTLSASYDGAAFSGAYTIEVDHYGDYQNGDSVTFNKTASGDYYKLTTSKKTVKLEKTKSGVTTSLLKDESGNSVESVSISNYERATLYHRIILEPQNNGTTKITVYLKVGSSYVKTLEVIDEDPITDEGTIALYIGYNASSEIRRLSVYPNSFEGAYIGNFYAEGEQNVIGVMGNIDFSFPVAMLGQSAKVVAAMYDGESLADVKVFDIKDVNTGYISLFNTLSNNIADCKIKVFFLNSLNSMYPLTLPFVYQ